MEPSARCDDALRQVYLAHLPEAPLQRAAVGQVAWTPRAMRKILEIVYDYRSRALHGGEPFPAPMCWVPTIFEGIALETPGGLAAATQGATWLASDTPINLHVFAYIVRGALLRWIASLT